MSYSAITSSLIKAGKSLTTTLVQLIADDFANHQTRILALESAGASPDLPTGTLLKVGFGSVPSGYLSANGAAVSRTTYAALFAVIGTTWGVGDGSTTFNLPDMRGRTAIGSGTGSGLSARTVGQTTGLESINLSASEMPAHSHTVVEPNSGQGHQHTLPDATTGGGGTLYFQNTASGSWTVSNGATLGSNAPAITVGSAGSDAAHQNMQPSLGVQYVVKT